MKAPEPIDPLHDMKESERITGETRRTLYRKAKQGLIAIVKINERRNGIFDSELRRYNATKKPLHANQA